MSEQSNFQHDHSLKRSNLYYGYIIVIIFFIMMMLGWGLFYIYGIFFKSLMTDFQWTRAVTSGAFSISVLVSGIAGIITGRLSDHFGPQKVIVFCAVLLTLGYSLMYFVQNTWQFYLLYGIIIASGVGGFWAPQVSTIARWFTGKRGFMTGIVSGGISFGTLILPPVVTRLIDIFGWRMTYLIIGVAIFIVIMVSAKFVKPGPQAMDMSRYSENKAKMPIVEQSLSFNLKAAISTYQFWAVATIYLFFGIAQLMVIVHIVPNAIGVGMSSFSAAGILSVIGGVSFIGRILIGLIADRIRVKPAAILSLGLMTIALLWLQQADNPWKLYVFAVFFGFGYGGLSCLQSLMAAELFGLLSLGVITGFFSLSFDIGGAIGPWLAGFIFDKSGSYTWAFILCLGAIMISLLTCLTLKPPKTKDHS
jgi:MFS family permease